MESEPIADWVPLRRFDQSGIANDVTTALLAMEYEASLLDLSDQTLVAGVGSRGVTDEVGEDLDGSTPDQHTNHLDGSPGSWQHASFTGESGVDSSRHRDGGGPWDLLVPAESAAELEEVLDTLIEEQLEFEHALDMRRRRRRFATRAAMLLGFILISLYIMLSLLKIA